ncbi:LuxR C-terminal-related transcriptional regulator [Streptomyces sp. 8N616]|uniref:LuxR C-terminal-related transcriptional regulator n=1 Tax=Streptomyces sp. 8N616 TaxID=3457414 RepID=UPI003FD602F1
MRILLVSDRPVLRAGIQSLLGDISCNGSLPAVTTSVAGREAAHMAAACAPDVVLVGADARDSRRQPVLPQLTAEHAVIFITDDCSAETVATALREGAEGCLEATELTARELISAIETVRTGRPYLAPEAVAALMTVVRTRPGLFGHSAVPDGLLTPRELDILDLMARGCGNHEIAGRLLLSGKTVRNYVSQIYLKLQVRDRAEAVALWLGTTDSAPARWRSREPAVPTPTATRPAP